MRTIAHLSDLHFGRHDPLLAQGVVDALTRLRPDLIAISGDLTQRARRTQFAAARQFIASLPAPVLVVPGNHDVPLYDFPRRFLSPLGRYQRYISSDLKPVFIDSEIAALGVNTARSATFSNGRISYEQADEIGAVFEAVPPDRFRIVVAHHPLMPPPDAPDLPVVGRAPMAVEALAASGVHLVLAGHHHHAFNADLAQHHLALQRSILIVEAGTTISLRRRDEANSFNLIEVEPGRLACTVQVWHEDCFIPLDTASYRLHGKTWTRA